MEPKDFLSIDSTTFTGFPLLDNGVRYPGSDKSLADIQIQFQLSKNKKSIEIHSYTFMLLLGDIGGFNGAIIIFPTYVMSWYSSRMFLASVYQEMPVKKS